LGRRTPGFRDTYLGIECFSIRATCVRGVAKPPDDDGLSGPSSGTRNARTKFLESVKAAADARHLEFVVDSDGPNTGYGYIQKRDSFSNFFAFHFEFGNKLAVFYLGTDSIEAATPEQRRQVEYRDGAGMEQVLQEIRNNINAAAGDAFPQLTALSDDRATLPPSPLAGAATAKPAPAKAAQTEAAVVWGQDMRTLNANRYPKKKVYRKSYVGEIASVALILLVIFTLAPVLHADNAITSCQAGTCGTYPAYYQSISFRFLGIGGVYVPQSNSSGILRTGTIQAGNGTSTGRISLQQFYIAW
jgi:hypothetical protein